MVRENNCPIATVETEAWTVDVPELVGLVNFALYFRHSYFQPVEFPPYAGIE